jgi:hypothetical protein
MPRLIDLQQQFSDYLLSKSDDISTCIIDDGKLSKQKRLDIYKNAYSVRLKKCIETDHPMLCKYLGDDLFEKMANGYINNHPSHYTSLRQYCRYMLDAFDAADDDLVSIEDLKSIDPEKWPTIKIIFHPGVYVFKAYWNSVECWQAIKNEDTPPEAFNGSQQYWLIWRGSDLLTQFRSLTLDAYSMFNCFISGKNYADVCEALLSDISEEQISEFTLRYLFEWLNAGLVTKIIIDN